jgi:hypothetical protein
MYEETMGKRKREILANIGQSIGFDRPFIQLPTTNLKIKHSLDVTTTFNRFVTPRIREYKPQKIVEIDEFSTSSNDIYNTNESQKQNNQQEICEHSKSNKCNDGKHVISKILKSKKGVLLLTNI